MDRYEGHYCMNVLYVALHEFFYLAVILDRYEGPQTVLTIALHGAIYLANIIDRY
jgi:hypothetical protein